MLKTFDNKIRIVGDDLKNTIKKNSKISIAASIFSIYGYESLKKELNGIGELRFIFTDPTFIKMDEGTKESKFFEINSVNRKKAISGSSFEINLKNELKGKGIAKECRSWCEQKVKFKSNKGTHSIQPMLILDNSTDDKAIYLGIDNLYKENAPEFIYYLTLYHIFNEFLEDINEDELANEKTGFKNSVIWNKLYDFQKDAALGVVKYYQEWNKSVLVLCPKKLGDNWKTFLNNYEDNPLLKDRFNYDVLYHTYLLREKGESNGMNLSRVNWENYDLIVIDESHNFRNNKASKDKISRYQKLLNIIRTGVKTKLLMLSATPVNNRFTDLKNQIALAYEGHTHIKDEKLNITASIDSVLRKAQQTFNNFSNLSAENRTSKNLLSELNQNFDFFKLLDSVTMARSRKHIEKYYNMAAIGKFPTRLPLLSIECDITTLDDVMSIEDIYKKLSTFDMSVYSPFAYIFESKKAFYSNLYDNELDNKSILKQSNRENNLKILMRVNFLKRLESSVDSFRTTLNNFATNIQNTISKIDAFHEGKTATQVADYDGLDEIDTDDEDWLDEEFSIGKKVKINLSDMNTTGWRSDLENDLHVALNILEDMKKVTPSHDAKLQRLKKEILNKLQNPINAGNKKLIIFTAFADTASYLYEGQNLQDCDTLINYDIHWNPVRIIQRFGRVDRIGSKNDFIQLINFWPQISLDEYINLKSRVETRIFMVDSTATGEDNVLTNKSSEMEFRKKQLQKLKSEVVDIEEIDSSISITDLGLNDFRMDLLNYINTKGDIKDVSSGIHAVCKKDLAKNINEGVIFILKNIKKSTIIIKGEDLSQTPN